MPKFTLRLGDEEEAQLDRLEAAVKARYQDMATTIPRFGELARETTRSSALRALLRAWDEGQAGTAFDAPVTRTGVPGPTHTEQESE